MVRITLRQLEMFKAIVQENGHVTRAAQKFGITQSAASMALAELEHLLGVELFQRQGRILRLSAIGERLLPRVDVLIEEAKQIETCVRQDSPVLTGELKIGASSTIGNYILPAYVIAFKEKYPQVNIELRVTNTKQVIEDLLKWQLDVGWIEGRCTHPHIQVTSWIEDELLVFCHAQHPLLKTSKITVKKAFQYLWILREAGSGTLDFMERAMPERFPLEISFLKMSSNEAIKQAVRNSHAISMLSKYVLKEELRQGTFKTLTLPKLQVKRPFYELALKARSPSPLSQAFQVFLANAGL